MKLCSRCKKRLKLDHFVKKHDTKDGLASRCRECNVEIQWKIKYGITRTGYDLLLKQQNGGCAICGGTQHPRYKYFSVDHDHDTGKVRGLLCSNCNVLIGMAGDDILILTKAISYLEKE